MQKTQRMMFSHGPVRRRSRKTKQAANQANARLEHITRRRKKRMAWGLLAAITLFLAVIVGGELAGSFTGPQALGEEMGP